MDTLRQIEAFVAVVRAGSYVGASQRQGDSKAALSRLVLELEARLGTRLLNRTTRRLSLTETGAAYFERCVQILDDLIWSAQPHRDAESQARLQSTLPGLIAKDPALSETLFQLHGVLGWALLALLALHIAGALMHWLIKRDGVMRRMSLFR